MSKNRPGPLRRFFTDAAQADPYRHVPAFGKPLPIGSAFTADTGEQQQGGIVASARRLTKKDIDNRNASAQGGAGTVQPWQEEAWDMLREVGEFRFIVSTLAGRMAQASLYVGKITPADSPGTAPEHADSDEKLTNLLHSIGDGVAGQGQLINRAGINLLVPGEVWLVGIPPRLVPGTPENDAEREKRAAASGGAPTVDRTAAQEMPVDDALRLIWRMLSVTEINTTPGGKTAIQLEDGTKIEADPDEIYAIRIWRSDPREAWQADSPTRATLPVLRELVGLTQHISAQIDSRLAGAGLLGVSAELDRHLKSAAGLDPSDPSSPILEALALTMQEPIKDRSSASAVVPLTVTVPDSVDVDKAFHHLTFSTPLDKESPKLRDEAIRRLALGLDAPPELLLGTGGMNHWGAWLVREDVVNTHLEPPLALICDALTTQFLRPMMRVIGEYTEEQIAQHVVWYDVDHLVSRPNRSQDAKDLFDRGELSGKSLREANGFEEGDAPEKVDGQQIPMQVQLAIDMASKAPSLVQAVGVDGILAQINKALADPNIMPDDVPAPEPDEVIVVEDETTGDGTSGDALPDSTPADAPEGTPANPGE